ncbi:hypothetical protein OCJ37_17520 [Xanthomonas sp. AM6]|uniref:hypothetical protein n=1 Tax=Xanthomonas sp. AM6 TaxID=2982531 RepID=UPI0021D9C940|nr:hypothetical protein [Xanthomonas sp. AM6]UYB51746.1 hypothetical protein OCJ37_17520 [Xanthomonas sp. AM6]
MDVHPPSSQSRKPMAMLVGLMRYALLRPRLKNAALRMLSLHPGVLLALKRFAVRAGLAADMGHRHIAINGRSRGPGGPMQLSSRAARIFAQLQAAAATEDGKRAHSD